MKVEWLYEAQLEFQELLAYYRAVAGEDAAREMADRILSAVEALAAAPRSGVLRRERLLGKHGFRTLLIGRYACVYRVEAGVVRVYHLTDADRDSLAALLGVREADAGRERPAMLRRSVFLRSTLRQPVKTALLLAVTALITFAFVSRVSEYLLIRQETDRLGTFYRGIGALESGDQWADTGEAVAYLEANPSVSMVDTYHYTSAVIEDDICNADTDLLTSDMTRYLAFYGTLVSCTDAYAHFKVDTVLAGMPEYIQQDYSVILYTSEAQRAAGPAGALGELAKGERYLAVGYYSCLAPCHIEYDEIGRQVATHALLSCPLEDGCFCPVPAGREADWSTPRLAELADFIQSVRSEQHALNIVPVKDMSALPLVQEADPRLYLTSGRWLDSRDNASERKACVISQSLASRRDLAVGDTLTLTLRDIPSVFGYFRPHPLLQESPFHRIWRPAEFSDGGVLSYGDPLADTSHLYAGPVQAETCTDDYEIVGVYEYRDMYLRTVSGNFAYIPASAVPESFAMTTAETLGDAGIRRLELLQSDINLSSPLPTPGEVSFVLAGPEEETRFMAAARSDLASLGFQASILENGWASFQAAAQPMRRSSLYNAAIFSAVLVAALCLIALVYYRMRRKDIAIARALGVPIRRCAAQAALPLALAGLLSAVPGGALGWRYTLDNAGAILRALDEFGGGGAASLSVWWLAALWGTVLALLLAAAVGGGLFLSARPVLELLQGGGAAREKRLAAQAEAGARSVPLPASAAPAAARQRDAALPTTERPGVGYVLRFIWRHIARSRLKSALAAVLAAGFTVGLAAIQLSITGSQAEIDWLYENTTVEAELVLERSGQSLRGSGFLRRDVIDRLMETGYVTRAYLEGSASGAVVRYTPALEAQGAGHITDEEQIRKTVRAFDDESVFLTPAGSGGGVAITYLDGWDGSLFSRDWDGGERIPLVLPKAVYDECGHGPDRAVGLVCKSFRVCEVAGYYEGNVAGEAGETDPILLPLSAYQMMCGSRMTTYTKAHVTLDPSLNRELEQFQRALLAAAAGQSGMLALRAVMWDEELRLAVAPLENSIQLMRVLYPVTLVLSLLAAAGIAALFVMTSAREAAILRILGTSRLRSRVMLALQTVFASLGGLLAGLAAALACAQRAGPALTAGLAGTSVLCAVLYLLAAVLGAAASAVSITNKNPLELLQARE